MRLSELPSLGKQTFKAWSDDHAPRMGAALSYYTIFSMAPLLVLIIAVAGLFFGEDAARGRIVDQLSGVLGQDTAEMVQTMIQKANKPRAGIIATVIGLATLLLGATGVMMELHDDLNAIWKVTPKTGKGGWKGTVRARLLAFSVVLGFGFLLMVSLVISAVLAAVGERLEQLIPGWVMLAYVLNYGLSIVIVALLMGTIFVLLPDVRIAWRDVWVGALVTSVLFHLGKFLIGLYLGKAGVGSPFGAAGSLAVLLVWVYYTSQVFLMGAEFTRIYTLRYGSPVQPRAGAQLSQPAQPASA